MPIHPNFVSLFGILNKDVCPSGLSVLRPNGHTIGTFWFALNKQRLKFQQLISSLLGSDDEGDGTCRGGGGDNGGSTEEEDNEEEERMEILVLGKYNTIDPDRMQQVLNCFTPEQMSGYECYCPTGFQQANMRRLLASVAGCPTSIPMTIAMSGISRMFVGELVEFGRIVMTERHVVGLPRKGSILKTEAGRQSIILRESATI